MLLLSYLEKTSPLAGVECVRVYLIETGCLLEGDDVTKTNGTSPLRPFPPSRNATASSTIAASDRPPTSSPIHLSTASAQHTRPYTIRHLAALHPNSHVFASKKSLISPFPISTSETPPIMPLEATMIVLDNSEPSRNGDYIPSRWEAQKDVAMLLFHTKTQSNPESSVGLLSMSGGPSSGPEVLTTLTTHAGKILDGLHRTKIGGAAPNLYTGIMIASLALKHRQNKAQQQRIVVFVCGDVVEGKERLVKLAKKMKKNNTSVDIVAFGDLGVEKVEKLRAFHEVVAGPEGSHLEIVPPGPSLLSDAIVASPILAGESGGGGAGVANGVGGEAGAAGGAGGEGFEFGVDPNLDPELALVLRMSMEEERERQAREQRAREEAEGRTQLESVSEEGERQHEGQGDGEKKDAGEDKMDTA